MLQEWGVYLISARSLRSDLENDSVVGAWLEGKGIAIDNSVAVNIESATRIQAVAPFSEAVEDGQRSRRIQLIDSPGVVKSPRITYAVEVSSGIAG